MQLRRQFWAVICGVSLTVGVWAAPKGSEKSSKKSIEEQVCGPRSSASVDLTQSGMSLHALEIQNQGTRGTCYAHAASTYLSAFLSEKDRKQGGCSPLELIANERGARELFDRDPENPGAYVARKATVNGGNPGLAAQELIPVGSCCSKKQLDERLGEDLYHRLDFYTELFHGWENPAALPQTPELQLLESQMIERRSAIEQDPSRAENPAARSELQKLKAAFEKADAEENVYYPGGILREGLTPEEQKRLDQISAKRMKAFDQFQARLERYLTREDAQYMRDLKRTKKLRGEANAFRKARQYELSYNEAFEINGIFNQNGCERTPENFKLISDLIADVKSIGQAMDFEPYAVLRGLSERNCGTGRLQWSLPTGAAIEEVSGAEKNIQPMAQAVREELRSGLPAMISFCGEVSKKDSLEDSKNWAENFHALRTGSGAIPADDEICGHHAAVIVGSRWNGERCELRLRNSWGVRCTEGSSEKNIFPCTQGDEWIPSEILLKSATSISRVSPSTRVEKPARR